jgi:hypothetical protein
MSSAVGPRRILRNGSHFLEHEEKFMARNTSNNNSDAAPDEFSNINYMPAALMWETGPVRGTRRIANIRTRHLSARNKNKSKNITRRRREKFLKTLSKQRRVPVRAQIQHFTPIYANNGHREHDPNTYNSYDSATLFGRGMGGLGSKTHEVREAGYKAARERNEEEAELVRKAEAERAYTAHI